MAGALAKIQTEHLQNTSLEFSHYTNLLRDLELLVLFYMQKSNKNMLLKNSFKPGLLIISEAGDSHQIEGCRSSKYLPRRSRQ